jgi:hypothetical protein
MEGGTVPKGAIDKTSSQLITSATSHRRTGTSLFAFLEGRDVKNANAEYKSWPSFTPDPVLITCASAPGQARAEFFGLLFQLIKEESGEVLYTFSAKKTAHGWHVRDPWQLVLRIYNKSGDVVQGLAHGDHDLIMVAGIDCKDNGNRFNWTNSVFWNVWNVAETIEISFPSHTIHTC